MNSRPAPDTMSAKLLPHLAEPIDAYALAERIGTTFTGCESALKAMHRRGLVRKIVRRKGGEFLAHHWVAK
jgi:predicted transcriptional regulator